MIALFLVGATACLGAQSSETKQQSGALGDRSTRMTIARRTETDWVDAATGHGAVGRVDPADLARLEKESAPGGNLGDGGSR
jgi:hypothetical protein